ncbi:glycosyltransferase family 39 protein [Leucobacter iarius]|uniref:Glycosyltransferase family 39 protein n=1 Tax=Leucobacter iarius TaxID=333963 RepID=A0ABN2LG99_9MICO
MGRVSELLTAPRTEAGRVAHRRGDVRTLLAAVAVGLAAALISAIGSWTPSLWGDEAASVLSATRPVDTLLPMLGRVDAVHGAYYLFLHGWIELFGASPFSVRLPSAISGGLCAAGVTWLCTRFGSLRFGVAAGLITAILPRMTYAGEEARSSAFSAVIATAICLIIVEILRREHPSRRWWAAYGAALAAGIVVFCYLALMALAVGAMLVATPPARRLLRPWALASGIAVLAASPVLVLAVLERDQIAFLGDREAITPDSVLVQMWFGSPSVAIIAWALIAVAVAGLVIELVRIRNATGNGRLGRSRSEAPGRTVLRPETLALAWLVIPIGAVLVASIVLPLYMARYGTFAAPAAAVLIALGLRRLARLSRPGGVPILAAVAALALLATVVPVWAAQRGPYAKNDSDWNEIAAAVRDRAEPGDAVVFDETSRPSRRPRLAMDTDPEAFRAVSDPTLRISYARSGTWYSSVFTVAEAAARGRFDGIDRVWLVEYADGGTTDDWGEAELRALGFRPVDRIPGHRSEILLYERTSSAST